VGCAAAGLRSGLRYGIVVLEVWDDARIKWKERFSVEMLVELVFVRSAGSKGLAL
jgi:hypothetical protein